MQAFGIGMLWAGVALLLAASFHTLWHNSLEHHVSRLIRWASALAGILCVYYGVRVLLG